MIKLICPRCMKPVPVADDFSGKEVTCPSCMKPFDAPARYNPAVLSEPPPAAPPPRPAEAAPAPQQEAAPVRPEPPPIPPRIPEPTMSPEPSPPPGLVPPTPPVHVPPVPTPQVPGYAHARGITFSPRVVAWMPAVLLTITFVCTFFPWIGSYLRDGPAVYSQSPWRAVFKSVSRNFALEKYMPAGGWIDGVTSDWGLLLPYLLLLILACVLAWADRAFLQNPQHASFVRLGMGGFWAWRRTVLAGLAGLAFLLVVIQVGRGFGMERAIRAFVAANPELVKQREAAAGSAAKLAAVENDEEGEVARYNLERTWWQDVALGCNLLAILAVCGSILLDRRGAKPPPKLLLHY